ncbi:MAG: hydroxymethylglutaryl-CoA lyase [Lautropia sp.]
MSDLPRAVVIEEEGPREGFQIETVPISTTDKVRLIEAIARTGVRRIDCVSFVNPTRVPGMADAEQVMRQVRREPGVKYTGLWLNARGLMRALDNPVDVVGSIRIATSPAFSLSNTGMDLEQTVAEQRRWLETYRMRNVEMGWGYVMTAFGCNLSGDVPVTVVVNSVKVLLDLADEAGLHLKGIYLADTVGRATPLDIERTIGAVRSVWPDLPLGLHLHDTRGSGLANAYAALRLGVGQFDAACGGLGGCPFAGHTGAAGNVCTEDLAHMCEEMGVATGIDIEALVECGRMAESIVGHPLPGKLLRSGTTKSLR